MGVGNAAAAETAEERRVAALMTQMERLLAEHQFADAERLFREAAGILPEHPSVLHEQARRLALAGKGVAARAIMERVVKLAPDHLPFWLSLAAVLRTLACREEELAALEAALELNPTHLVALLQKGSLLEIMSKPRAAATIYGRALQTLSPATRMSPSIEAHVEHARKRVAENAAQAASVLDQRLADLRARKPLTHPDRFERCMDRMLGRRRIYVAEPTGMLFPFLVNFEFYARDSFPWLGALEEAADEIRQELLDVLASDRQAIQPYIAYEKGLPLHQWSELNHSRRWGAYFLWNEGRREQAHAARCPRTMEALAQCPQVDIEGRGPTAFFSILEPRTHIPPHTGVTNTRVTVHLPLIIPPGCRFRVGGETRSWVGGAAWVFDDTIEHEAWNDSDLARAILIFDVWNPQLTELERDLVREATAALAQYNAAEGHVPGVAL